MFSKIANIIRKIVVGAFLIHLVYTVLLRWVNPPITLTQLGSVVGGYGLTRDMVDIDDISGNALLAVMAAEDQLFPDHNGFDLKSIEDALEKKKGRIRGASTISQQVAKNVFLWQGRSWVRKGLEAYCTFLIELIWTKERILEVYMNVAEMGPGIFGIEAASQHYFNKSASKLTRNEGARIAACLPNPKKYKVAPPSPYVLGRSTWILTQMNNLETDPGIKKVLGEPARTRR